MEEHSPGRNTRVRPRKISKQGTVSEVTVQKNIETIMELEKGAVECRSAAERVADKVTTFAGSTPFIILHITWFGLWILINKGALPGIGPFDPFPFSFLTLVVSLEAIFLTLLVLMSQNRMTKEADKRAHLDLQLNMLSEQEGTMILRLVKKISNHFGLEQETEETIRPLEEETDVNQLANILKEKLPD